MRFTGFEVPQVSRGWLEIVAETNECRMIVALDVAQASREWSNLDAAESAVNKSTSFEVSQLSTRRARSQKVQ